MPSENTKNTCSENNGETTCDGNCESKGENCCGNCKKPKDDSTDEEVSYEAFLRIATTVLATFGMTLIQILPPTQAYDQDLIVIHLRRAVKDSGERLNYDMSDYRVGDEEFFSPST